MFNLKKRIENFGFKYNEDFTVDDYRINCYNLFYRGLKFFISESLLTSLYAPDDNEIPLGVLNRKGKIDRLIFVPSREAFDKYLNENIEKIFNERKE